MRATISMNDKSKKNLWSGIIIFIIVILIASSTIGILTRNNNSGTGPDAGNTEDNASNRTELYAFFSSNDGASDNLTLTMSNGVVFNYTKPGANFSYSLNDTIDIDFMIINHEHKEMNYNVTVYHAVPDMLNDTFDITYLYIGPVSKMLEDEVRGFTIQVNPAYRMNNSKIGIAVIEDLPGNRSRMINFTDINVNVY
jgi:hypothetical protein